jgi:hypothetical protein
MNKKRIALTYTYLFLFAFTLALSFTLASQAKAEHLCCVTMCDQETLEGPISYIGHEVWVKYVGYVCVLDNTDPCDFAYVCPEP